MRYKSRALTLLALCAFAVLLAAPDLAADGEWDSDEWTTPAPKDEKDAEDAKALFPAITKGKAVMDEWWDIFSEGKKVGYERQRMWEAQTGGKNVLLFEDEEREFVSIDGKKKEATRIDRYLMMPDTYEPLCYVKTWKASGIDYKTECKIDKVENGYKVQVAGLLNGKTHRRSGTIETEEKIYFVCGALLFYLNGPFKKGEDFLCASLDVDGSEMDTDPVYLKYLGDKHFMLGNAVEVWINDAGSVLRAKHKNAELEHRLSDEKKALGEAVNLPDYKGPDYRDGDTVTLGWLGLKITRSNPSQYFAVSHDTSGMVVGDPMSDLEITVLAFMNVPEKTDYAEVLARLRKMSGLAYADGKAQKTEAGEFFTGEYKNNDEGVERKTGRYYIFLRNQSAYVVTADGRGDTFERHQKQAEACVNSMRFPTPVIKDRSFLTHVDPGTGLKITRPSYAWMTLHIGKQMLISHPWTRTVVVCGTLGPADPQKVAQVLQQNLNPTYMKMYTIDGHKAIFLQCEVKRPDEIRIMSHVYIFMPDRTISVTVSTPKDDFKSLEKDIEQIVKSIQLPESTKEEADND